MEVSLHPIAVVSNSRKEAIDDGWSVIISEIVLADNIPTEAFSGIEAFSHLEIIYYFDKAEDADVIYSGRPRGNPAFPVMGIFGQRKKDRPNHIGLCTVELLQHSGRTIRVKNLDAINGTPVLDIKPVFKKFQPQNEIKNLDGLPIL